MLKSRNALHNGDLNQFGVDKKRKRKEKKMRIGPLQRRSCSVCTNRQTFLSEYGESRNAVTSEMLCGFPVIEPSIFYCCSYSCFYFINPVIRLKRLLSEGEITEDYHRLSSITFLVLVIFSSLVS